MEGPASARDEPLNHLEPGFETPHKVGSKAPMPWDVINRFHRLSREDPVVDNADSKISKNISKQVTPL